MSRRLPALVLVLGLLAPGLYADSISIPSLPENTLGTRAFARTALRMTRPSRVVSGGNTFSPNAHPLLPSTGGLPITGIPAWSLADNQTSTVEPAPSNTPSMFDSFTDMILKTFFGRKPKGHRARRELAGGSR